MAVTDGMARSCTNPAALAAIVIGAVVATVVLAARAMRVWSEGANTIDRTVELVIEAGATACAGWLAIGAAVGLLYAAARRTGRDWHAGRAFLARCAPRLVRRMAGVAVTASVGIGVVAPGAFAAPLSASEGDAAAQSGVVLDLGWQPTSTGPATGGLVGGDLGTTAAGLAGPGALTPDRRRGSTGQPGSGRARDPERTRQVDRKTRGGGPRNEVPVVVKPGDTLWSIATEHLRPDVPTSATVRPDTGRVANEVSAWHAANLEAIGPDPDLIRPGTVLHAPDARTPGAQP